MYLSQFVSIQGVHINSGLNGGETYTGNSNLGGDMHSVARHMKQNVSGYVIANYTGVIKWKPQQFVGLFMHDWLKDYSEEIIDDHKAIDPKISFCLQLNKIQDEIMRKIISRSSINDFGMNGD